MIRVVKEIHEKEQVIVRVNVDGKFRRRLVLVADTKGYLNVDDDVYNYFTKEERPSLKKQLLRIIDVHNEMNRSASMLQMQQELKQQEERERQYKESLTEEEKSIMKSMVTNEEQPLTLYLMNESYLKLMSRLQAFPYQSVSIPNGERKSVPLYINQRQFLPIEVSTFYQLSFNGTVIGLFLNKKEILKLIPINQLATLFEIEAFELKYHFFPTWKEITQEITQQENIVYNQ